MILHPSGVCGDGGVAIRESRRYRRSIYGDRRIFSLELTTRDRGTFRASCDFRAEPACSFSTTWVRVFFLFPPFFGMVGDCSSLSTSLFEIAFHCHRTEVSMVLSCPLLSDRKFNPYYPLIGVALTHLGGYISSALGLWMLPCYRCRQR